MVDVFNCAYAPAGPPVSGSSWCAIIRRPCSNGHSVGAWPSLVGRIVRDDEVGGSNPLAPTKLTFFTRTTRPEGRVPPTGLCVGRQRKRVVGGLMS